MLKIEILKTNSANLDFQKLVSELDVDLAARNGSDHQFYHQFNGITMLKNCIVLYENKEPVACGAFKKYDEVAVEVKRMFVKKTYRGKGYAKQILKYLEIWAKEDGYQFTILETGVYQPEAIALYHKEKYQLIDNFDQYIGVDTSVCFMKKL